MSFFSIRWDLDKPQQKPQQRGPFNSSTSSSLHNFVTVRVTCLDARGRVRIFTKQHEQWIGVCTGRINRVLATFGRHFPGAVFRHSLLMEKSKKILPYFCERLVTGKLDYVAKPFYRVYATGASVHDVGRFFARKYKVAYHEKSDWTCRLCLDVCSRSSSTSGFFYKWYEVDDSRPGLLDAFRMVPERTDSPDWSVAAFDLETVPMDGEERVPTGVHPTDRIVMISLVKWKCPGNEVPKRYLLYLDPVDGSEPFRLEDVKVLRYARESKLLEDFHRLISQCQVLTGYNVDGFDLPCLFARLMWLRMHSLLGTYRSSQVGDTIVTTVRDKLVIDLYAYFRTFSNYDLPGFKLDDVAKVKLGDVHKLPVKSTGIHAWYASDAVASILHSDDPRECFRILKPRHHVSEHQFGTFRTYLEYCMRDSDLVHRLFCKENVLSFLLERANFTTLDLVHALHLGNSRFIVEMFKSYGTLQGYFVNMRFFDYKAVDKYRSMFVDDGRTYQGALNYCIPKRTYTDVSVMDFVSMYPSTLVSSNLCYGTCDILTREELMALDPGLRAKLIVVPYRNHSERDFEEEATWCWNERGRFRYPEFDVEQDLFAFVINPATEGFLVDLNRKLIALRKHHQVLSKKTGLPFHHNQQLNLKILINSNYGVMANKDSPLSYLPIAIIIVTLARYQLLGSYHFMKKFGYEVCYADTDSLMVPRWPHSDCKMVNDFLGIPDVELKYEQRIELLLVLSKKRYVYTRPDGRVVSKGFQKKINGLVEFMSNRILRCVIDRYKRDAVDASDGWIAWVETLLEANYLCRDPKKFSITRKAKMLQDYKSTTCATYRMLQKHPEKENGYVEYAFSRADVAIGCQSLWIMDVERVKYANFEQLFMSQKKIFVDLLNMAFWNLKKPHAACDMVLNTMRWKSFVHAELLNRFATGKKRVTMFVERGVKYTFKINDQSNSRSGRLVREVGEASCKRKTEEVSSPPKRKKVDVPAEKTAFKRKRSIQQSLEESPSKK